MDALDDAVKDWVIVMTGKCLVSLYYSVALVGNDSVRFNVLITSQWSMMMGEGTDEDGGGDGGRLWTDSAHHGSFHAK